MNKTLSPQRLLPVKEEAATLPKGPPQIFGRRARLVSFSKIVKTREIERRIDMSTNEIATIWYNGNDLHAIKQTCYPTIKKMALGLPLDDDEEPRGLEIKTPQGHKRRQLNKFLAIDAVLEEQNKQWDDNNFDFEYLSQIYRQSSTCCQMAAYLVGKADEKFVNDHVRDTQAVVQSSRAKFTQPVVEATFHYMHKPSLHGAILAEIKLRAFLWSSNVPRMDMRVV
jgi:hypothetical protein